MNGIGLPPAQSPAQGLGQGDPSVLGGHLAQMTLAGANGSLPMGCGSLPLSNGQPYSQSYQQHLPLGGDLPLPFSGSLPLGLPGITGGLHGINWPMGNQHSGQAQE